MKRILLVISLAILLLQSCSKEKQLENPKENISKLSTAEKIEIDSLKSYLSKIYHLDKKELVFDENTEVFMFRGVEQVSKIRLIEIKGN